MRIARSGGDLRTATRAALARIDRFDRSFEPDRVAAESVSQRVEEIAAVDSRERGAIAALQRLRIEAVDRRAVGLPEGDGVDSRCVDQLAKAQGSQRMNGIRPNRETGTALVKRRVPFRNPDRPPAAA